MTPGPLSRPVVATRARWAAGGRAWAGILIPPTPWGSVLMSVKLFAISLICPFLAESVTSLRFRETASSAALVRRVSTDPNERSLSP
jgi:hypothetical protein